MTSVQSLEHMTGRVASHARRLGLIRDGYKLVLRHGNASHGIPWSVELRKSDNLSLRDDVRFIPAMGVLGMTKPKALDTLAVVETVLRDVVERSRALAQHGPDSDRFTDFYGTATTTD